jgi:polo-like kinase 1
MRGKLLGSGGFAKCFEAVNLADNKTYALKVIPKKEINEKRKRYKLMLEIKLHRSLRHRNIVAFRDVFEDSENVYIVLEYCQNNTLKELVKRRKRITEYEAQVYMLQMVKALQFIHRNSIVHRDLKLGNILVNNSMQLKLCDFGLSTKINYQGEKKRTVCGTPNYIAPEIL